MMEIRINGYIRINRDLFIRKGVENPYFEETKGKIIKFKGYEKFDFFAHKVKKGRMEFWVISEAISGCRIGKLNKSLRKAIDRADQLIHEQGADRVEYIINQRVGNKYIAPGFRFVANPNNVVYVATKKHKIRKHIFPRRYRVRLLQE